MYLWKRSIHYWSCNRAGERYSLRRIWGPF